MCARSSFCASSMSSLEILPISTRCAMTRPRVSAKQSEQLLEEPRLHRRARGGGLEHMALPIFLVRRTAPLASSRYTIVCTVV